jgi:chromosome segregation ATPase
LDSDLDELRLERLGLECQLPDLRKEHAAMRGKLARLRREIRAAEVERDGLLAMAVALREHVAETSEQTEQDSEELPALRREDQALRRRNSELEGPRTGFGFPMRFLRIGTWTGRQRFDDS